MSGCRCAGRQPCACSDDLGTPTGTGRRLTSIGRVVVERTGDNPAQFTRNFDRNYDVQAYTGYATSDVPAGGWARGTLYRQAMPVLALHSPGPMFDRSNPATWPRTVG